MSDAPAAEGQEGDDWVEVETPAPGSKSRGTRPLPSPKASDFKAEPAAASSPPVSGSVQATSDSKATAPVSSPGKSEAKRNKRKKGQSAQKASAAAASSADESSQAADSSASASSPVVESKISDVLPSDSETTEPDQQPSDDTQALSEDSAGPGSSSREEKESKEEPFVLEDGWTKVTEDGQVIKRIIKPGDPNSTSPPVLTRCYGDPALAL